MHAHINHMHRHTHKYTQTHKNTAEREAELLRQAHRGLRVYIRTSTTQRHIQKHTKTQKERGRVAAPGPPSLQTNKTHTRTKKRRTKTTQNKLQARQTH